MEGEGDDIKSKQASKRDRTLNMYLKSRNSFKIDKYCSPSHNKKILAVKILNPAAVVEMKIFAFLSKRRIHSYAMPYIAC